MNKLIEEYKEKFKKMKEELGFKSTYEDIENIFFIEDFIQSEGFVSMTLSRAVCRRICDLFIGWSNYLHALVVPNPNHMINLTESQFFSDAEKHELINLMNQIMAHTSLNNVIGQTKDKKIEAVFIDDSVTFWIKDLNPKLIDFTKKIHNNWKEKLK
ncbi:hypothetical protein HN789_05050 [archaeon]|jgi:hypothetical protein|nr:hypothetical protein [archaeon]MBT4022880.1 hypothetical protein [archaeon]MBT4272527.1 hypothetical protein [archaeon]MBT4460405.1 hypothetical protein [archaeon]MBT4859036.1 hypothetical protein [archaeon]